MIQKFEINIDQILIEDLKNRIQATRWPDELDNENWDYGTNKAYLQELATYWKDKFNWKAIEEELNQLFHFKADVDGSVIHFIHEKGAGENAIPILLTHGWPDSFVRFLKIIPLLTAVDEHGISFDVIIPSIPGFGFSDKPSEPGMNPAKIAGLFTKLMADKLGYKQFIAQGGDWGSSITEQIAIQNPKALIGIHLTDIPWRHLYSIPTKDQTEEEKEYLEAGKKWQQTEGAYAMIQSTKPQSLAYGLNDSPMGLAGWIIEKFRRWSDCDGDLSNTYTKDELLTNLTIYWATQTINSSVRIYYETMQAMQKPTGKMDTKVMVPTGVAIFPKDLITAPRAFAERFFNIVQWTTMNKGGHFAAMEQPHLLAEDIRSFARKLNVIAS